MNMQPSTKRSAGFVDDLNGAVRENPVAAGLIGMGVLWMFFGGSKLSMLGGSVANASQHAAGAFGSGVRTVAKAVGDWLTATGVRAGDAARNISSTLNSGIQNAGAGAREAIEAASSAFSNADDVADSSSQARSPMSDAFASSATSMKKNLSAALERQPLLLGAIGVAVGAGIASTFPSTQMENELVGETGAKVKEKVVEFAADTADTVLTRAEQALDEVTKEASARGLTPSAAKDQFEDVAGKIKTVAAATRDSVKDRLS